MESFVKLSNQTIPTLLEIYKAAGYPRHALTHCSLRHYLIQSEKYPEYSSSLELVTLNENWRKDGLFLMKNGNTYYFDSLEPQPFDRLKKLLLNIDYSKEVVFRAVRDHFKPMVNEVLWLKNLEITDQTGTTVYFLTRDFMMQLPQPPIPEGWYFRHLTLDDVPEINQKLLREGGDHLRYVEHSIKYKLSLGLFDENGLIQSWIYSVDIGTLGTIGVTENYQQKGAASAIGIKFVQILLKDFDMDLAWNTAHGNDAGHALAKSFKAKNVGTVTWMAVNKRVSTKMSQMGMYQIFYPKL